MAGETIIIHLMPEGRMHSTELSGHCPTCIAAAEGRPSSEGPEPAPQGDTPPPGVEHEVGAASESSGPSAPSSSDIEGEEWYGADPPQDAGAVTEAKLDAQLAKLRETFTKRTFETGATRDTDTDKLDYEGFLSPAVLKAFAEYMHKNRYMADGSMRDSDNWQKGIPVKVYMKSKWRHHMDSWTAWRNLDNFGQQEVLIEALLAELFNIQGALHELLKED